MNLPTEVVLSTGKITYTYDAMGIRLKKQVVPTGGTAQTIDYLSGFQYENGVLKFFTQAEGFVEYKNNEYIYNYVHRDHLGNNRLIYADLNKNDKIDAGEIIEENNYYPFGLKHQGYNELAGSEPSGYKYKFGAKELQNELGLNIYDFEARGYMPDLGRFFNHDPLAEVSADWSPCRYGYNNPVIYSDPSGMLETRYKDEEGNTLLNTKDGSDDEIIVSDAEKKDFRYYNASYQSGNKNLYDSKEWNENMKASILGFGSVDAMNSVLDGFTRQWSRQNAINYLQNPTLGNAMAMAYSEAATQWTDPEKLIMGASILVGGISPRAAVRNELKVYRVFGGDARAQGYSWTTINPESVKNFRNAAGLPSGGASGAINTADFMIQGKVNTRHIIKYRSALPLDGNKGGLPELIIDPKNVILTDFKIINP